MVDENYLRVFDALGKQFLPFRLIRGWLMSCVFYDAVPAVPFTIGLNCEFSFLWFLVSFVPDLTCSEFFQIIALLSIVWITKKMAHFWTRCANWVILDVIQGWLFEWLNRRIAIGAKPGSSVTTIMFLFEWLLRGIFAAWLKQWELRICCRPVWLDCEDFTGQSNRAYWRQGGLSCVSCCGDGRLEGLTQRFWKLVLWKQ